MPAIQGAVSSRAVTWGCWSAVCATLLTLLFAALSMVFVPAPWAGIEAYAAGLDFRHMLSFVPALLLAPAMMALFASLHAITPEEKRMLTLLGLAFAGVYAAIVCTNYYVQLFVVRLNLINGELEGLALLAMPNLRSLFFALECIGYGFLSLATLTVSPVFVGAGVARWIRLLFVANGLVGIGGMAVALLDRPLLIFAGLGLWSIIFPVATGLVALYFRSRRAVPGYAALPSAV